MRLTIWYMCFPVSFSEIFKKAFFVVHVQTGCLSKLNQKNCVHKIYLQENIGDGVLFSAVADMCAYSFSKMDFIINPFP